MTAESIPWFVVAICQSPGVLLIALGMPLLLRRVPPNPTYGVRMPGAYASDIIWYDINARGGRDFVAIGVGYLVLFNLGLVFGRSWSINSRVLGPLAVMFVAIVVDSLILYFAAERLTQRR